MGKVFTTSIQDDKRGGYGVVRDFRNLSYYLVGNFITLTHFQLQEGRKRRAK